MAGRFRFKFRNIWKQQTKTAAGDITSTYGYGELYADLDESQMDLAPVYPAPPLSAPPLPAPPLPPARARAVSSPEQPILGEGESDYYVNIPFPPPVPPKSPVLTGAAGGTGGCRIRPPAPKPAPDDDTSQRYSGLVHTRSRPPSWVSSEAEERRSADIRTDTGVGDSDQRDVILPGETECSSPEDKKVSTKYSTIDNSTKCERLKKKATSAPGNPPLIHHWASNNTKETYNLVLCGSSSMLAPPTLIIVVNGSGVRRELWFSLTIDHIYHVVRSGFSSREGVASPNGDG